MKFPALVLVALCISTQINAKVDETVICQLGVRLTKALPEPLRLTPQTVGGVRYLTGTCEAMLRTKFDHNIYTTLQQFYKALMHYGAQELQRSLPPSVSAVERENLTNVMWELFRYHSGEAHSDGTEKTPFRAPLAKALLVLGEVEVHQNPTARDLRKAFNEVRNELEQVFRSESDRLVAQNTVPLEDVEELISLFNTYLRQFQESWLDPAFLWRSTKQTGLVLGALSALRLLYKLNNLASYASNATIEVHRAAVKAQKTMAGVHVEWIDTKQKLDGVLLPLKHRLDNGLGEGLTDANRGQFLHLFQSIKTTSDKASAALDRVPGLIGTAQARLEKGSWAWGGQLARKNGESTGALPEAPPVPEAPKTPTESRSIFGWGSSKKDDGAGLGEQ